MNKLQKLLFLLLFLGAGNLFAVRINLICQLNLKNCAINKKFSIDIDSEVLAYESADSFCIDYFKPKNSETSFFSTMLDSDSEDDFIYEGLNIVRNFFIIDDQKPYLRQKEADLQRELEEDPKPEAAYLLRVIQRELILQEEQELEEAALLAEQEIQRFAKEVEIGEKELDLDISDLLLEQEEGEAAGEGVDVTAAAGPETED